MAVPRGRLRFGPDSGRLLLRTRRSGFASRVGHDLTIEVTVWSAEVDVSDPTNPVGARVEATADLRSLEVREGTGGAVPLTDRDRREIEDAARRILMADRDPMAVFASDWITATPVVETIGGTLTIGGTAAPIVLQVREVSPDHWRVATTVVQTAFGIKPYSAFLGALKLRDEVEVECHVDLDAAERTDAA